MFLLPPKFLLFLFFSVIGIWIGLQASSLLALSLYFSWLIFEDLIRKLAGNDIAFYFAKYFLMAGIALQLIRRRLWRCYSFPPSLVVWTGLWALVVIGNSFNPNLVHPLQSLVGIHADLLFLTIFLPAGYWLPQKSDELRRFMTIVCLLIIFPTAVAFVQWVYDPSFLNTAVMVGTELRPINVRGMITQVNSVFTEHGRFANYVEMIFWYGLSTAILYASPKVNLPQVVGWLGMSLASVDMLLLAKRRPILNTLLGLLLFAFWILSRKRFSFVFSLRNFAIAGMLVFILYFLTPQIFEPAQNFLQQTLLGSEERPSEVTMRMPGYLEQLQVIGDVGLFGHGTGSVALGLQYLQTRLGIDIPEPVTENGFADKAWNYGIVGLLVWCGFIIQLLWELFRSLNRADDLRWKMFRCLVLCWALPYFTVSQLIGSHFMTDYLAQSHYWFLIGLALRRDNLLGAGMKLSKKEVVMQL
ncbi:MAG: hypothetical protein SLRJCFUN_001876 [Candidatus Fervidibacter sp.]